MGAKLRATVEFVAAICQMTMVLPPDDLDAAIRELDHSEGLTLTLNLDVLRAVAGFRKELARIAERDARPQRGNRRVKA